VIGLDTNVLVRYLVQDEPDQAAAASRLIDSFTAEGPGFVSTVTLVETVWVLARAYRTPKAEIADIIEGLLRSQDLVVEQAEIHYVALGRYRSDGADYSDAVIAQAGRRAGCSETVTFDRAAAKGAEMRLLGEAV
jgi:predicted nucleic-acid-binding protein